MVKNLIKTKLKAAFKKLQPSVSNYFLLCNNPSNAIVSIILKA